MDPAVGGQADLAGAAGGVAASASGHRGPQMLQRRSVEFRVVEAAVARKPAAADEIRHHHRAGAGFGQ